MEGDYVSLGEEKVQLDHDNRWDRSYILTRSSHGIEIDHLVIIESNGKKYTARCTVYADAKHILDEFREAAKRVQDATHRVVAIGYGGARPRLPAKGLIRCRLHRSSFPCNYVYGEFEYERDTYKIRLEPRSAEEEMERLRDLLMK